MTARFNTRWTHVRIFLAALSLLVIAACESPEQKAQSHYQRGLELLKKDKPVKAGLELKNALQFKEDFVAALYALATVEERKKNWRGVAGILKKVVDLDPKHVEARIKLGKLLLLAGQSDQALKFANAAQALMTDGGEAVDAKTKADVLALKAASLYKLDDKEGAVRLAKQARLED